MNVMMYMTAKPSCCDREGCEERSAAAFEPGMLFKQKYETSGLIVLVKRVPDDGPIYYNLPCWEVLVGENPEIISDRFLLRDCKRIT